MTKISPFRRAEKARIDHRGGKGFDPFPFFQANAVRIQVKSREKSCLGRFPYRPSLLRSDEYGTVLIPGIREIIEKFGWTKFFHRTNPEFRAPWKFLYRVRYIIDRFETTSAIVPISRSLSAFVIKALARDIIALLLYSYVLYVFVYVYIRAGVVFAELTFLVANSDAISEAR